MFKALVVGRLCNDPELKYLPDTTAVCTFRIAVDRRGKDSDGNRKSDFFTVNCWRQTAEFAANYLAKGRQVAIDGRVENREWTTNEGQKRTVTEIQVDNLQAIGPRPKGEENGG